VLVLVAFDFPSTLHIHSTTQFNNGKIIEHILLGNIVTALKKTEENQHWHNSTESNNSPPGRLHNAKNAPKETNVSRLGTETTPRASHDTSEMKNGNKTIFKVALIRSIAGEMANNMGFFANAYLQKLQLEAELNQNENAPVHFQVDIVAEHQDHPWKWQRAFQSMQCFEHLQLISVFGGRWDPLYDKVYQWQEAHLAPGSANTTVNLKSSALFVERSLDQMKRFDHIVLDRHRQSQQRLDMESNGNTALSIFNKLAASNTTMTLPFLRSAGGMTLGGMRFEVHLEDIRRFFTIKASCCGPQHLQPDPDATVFHLRNFITENKKHVTERGYVELDPHNTAHVLLGHLTPGSKVVVVSRYWNASNVQEYITAMTQRGLNATVLQPSESFALGSGIHDFCYLRSATKELIGTSKSTYVRWAALLGPNLQKATLYKVDKTPTPQLGETVQGSHISETWYPYKRQDLQHIRHVTVKQ